MQQRAEEAMASDPRVDLAVERTGLALERTHLAWIRTMFTIMTDAQLKFSAFLFNYFLSLSILAFSEC